MEKTIAEYLATEAKSLSYRDLPPEVVKQVKRSLLDTLGVGFGGYISEPSDILQNVIKDADGPAESTVLGSGVKTSCLYATLANGLMVRYLNNIDRAFLTKECLSPGGSNQESIPGVLAVAERQHCNGGEVITGIALAYEMLNKIFDSLGGNNKLLDKTGWAHETMRTPCAMALVAAKLLGSTEEQMANALSLAGCFNFALGALNGGEVELTMARNLRFPYGAYGGILGALLARKGFKGPLNVFEGHHGLSEVLTGNAMDLEKLKQPRKDWTILYTQIRNLGVGGHMHGLIEASLILVKKHDLKAEDIETLSIKTNSHTQRILANPKARRYPKTRETADHSAYYCAAIAIIDRMVGPDQFAAERLQDPNVHALMDKVTIEVEPRLETLVNPALVEITTKKGEKLSCEVLHPKGTPMNPMTDADVEEKFRGYAKKFLGEQQMKQIIDTVYNLEKLKDIGDLAKLLVFPKGN